VTRLLARLRREQRGFTLVEMLVACSIGTIVLLAAFTMLDTSVVMTGRVADRVDRTQRGRLAMELITRKLRSQVCPTPGQGALIDAQDYSVKFYSFMGTGAFVPDILEIAWDTNTNSILQRKWAGTGTSPNTTYAATPTTSTLLSDVRPNFSPPDQTSTRGPVFTYYIANSGSALTTPLSAADLTASSKIGIQFMTYAQGRNASGTSTTLQSEVFSRTADPNGVTGSTAPECA
jgi:prepilin-type N-terminal cleavage/methylation domain-containing protein